MGWSWFINRDKPPSAVDHCIHYQQVPWLFCGKKRRAKTPFRLNLRGVFSDIRLGRWRVDLDNDGSAIRDFACEALCVGFYSSEIVIAQTD